MPRFEFDWWAQALADQGYAVLQPNYRGSDVTFKFIEAGYGAALAGVTLQSGIYRCAVSVAGVADLPRMRNWTKHTQQGRATRYWDRFWGVAENDNHTLKAISPIDHLQGVSAPILLITVAMIPWCLMSKATSC